MCGIAGSWSRGPGEPARVKRMLTALAHRGPDDEGLQSLDEERVVLGHRRLSILDLSKLGHQPMRAPERPNWIVYNGEIYNFRTLRKELSAAGHRFRSDSDTEVVLAAYAAWGLACVERFEGMFAFALWDDANRQLHLCRDRFGVKPLYYRVNAEELLFASELKGLHAAGATGTTVDPQAMAEFLQYGYFCAPRTPYADVSSVPPGCILSFGPELRPREHQYWRPRDLWDAYASSADRRKLAALSEDEMLEHTEATLRAGFEARMVSDVPVGVFLSGGIDSTLVTALLAADRTRTLKTFTIGYGGSEFDETHHARAVAGHLGTEHVEFTVGHADMLALVDEITSIADEPIGNSSVIPTLLLSRLAREHVTVALSADGADELFAGYARYHHCGRQVARLGGLAGGAFWLAGAVLDRIPTPALEGAYRALVSRERRFAGIGAKVRKFARMTRAKSPFEAYEAAVTEWDAVAISHIGSELRHGPETARAAAQASFERLTSNEPEAAFMHFDANRYLPGDLLTKMDRASMAVSLESREPFLDQGIARLGAALPMSWKLHEGKGKHILRRLLARHVPREHFERPKHGFSAPVGEWLRGPLRSQLIDELAPDRVRRLGILDAEAVRIARDDFLAHRGTATPAGIWFLFELQRWAGRWLDPASSVVAVRKEPIEP